MTRLMELKFLSYADKGAMIRQGYGPKRRSASKERRNEQRDAASNG